MFLALCGIPCDPTKSFHVSVPVPPVQEAEAEAAAAWLAFVGAQEMPSGKQEDVSLLAEQWQF